MIRVVAVIVLFCSTISTAAAADCTRESLQAVTDRYLDALKQGKPSLMPLTAQAGYNENKKDIAFGEGIWKAPLSILY